jgi:hypothetical protein
VVAAARRRGLGHRWKKLRHPVLGPLDYTHVVLQVADQPDQSMVTYSAGPTPEHRQET